MVGSAKHLATSFAALLADTAQQPAVLPCKAASSPAMRGGWRMVSADARAGSARYPRRVPECVHTQRHKRVRWRVRGRQALSWERGCGACGRAVHGGLNGRVMAVEWRWLRDRDRGR